MGKSKALNLCLTILLSLAAANAPAFAAKTIYVDADATGANNGSSWTDAYRFLQDALTDADSSAKPAEIRVAQGTYRPDEDSLHPDGTGSREATFQLIDGVTLKGGYAGFGERDPNAWDVELYKTILSGDLNGDDVNVGNPADLRYEPTRAENSYHVTNGSGTDPTAVMNGFTITGAYTGGYGGGMLIREGGSPTLINCIFAGNWAQEGGGGIGNYMGSPVLFKCTLSGNSAEDTGGGMLTSGEGQSNLTLINCTFSDNFVQGQGGGMYNEATRLTLTNCRFTRNSAAYGGAMDNVPLISGTLTNCTFIGNSATQSGGVMRSILSNVLLTNCTFTGNSAPNGNALACDWPIPGYPSNIEMTNCVLWDGGNEVVNTDNSEIEITYSDLQDGWLGQDNIAVDPCFADPCNGDYHLKSQAGRWDANEGRWAIDDVTSPCIDAGDPMSPIGPEPFPNGGIINMGAYGGTGEASKSYFGEPSCETIVAGDINGDCQINFKDFFFIALHWLTANTP